MPERHQTQYGKAAMAAEREAERQRLAEQILSALPPPAAGMSRIMWFGNANTPRPVDIPESVETQIAGVWARVEANKGPFYEVPYHEYRQARADAYRLIQPFLEAQYPECRPPAAWWKRALHKLGLRF